MPAGACPGPRCVPPVIAQGRRAGLRVTRSVTPFGVDPARAAPASDRWVPARTARCHLEAPNAHNSRPLCCRAARADPRNVPASPGSALRTTGSLRLTSTAGATGWPQTGAGHGPSPARSTIRSAGVSIAALGVAVARSSAGPSWLDAPPGRHRAPVLAADEGTVAGILPARKAASLKVLNAISSDR